MVKNEIEPQSATPIIANVLLPYSLKFFYGIIADSMPIFGSTRKSYLFLFSMIQLITSVIASFYMEDNYMVVCVCGFFISLSLSFMDVVTDGILVNQQKLDQVRGSEDLQLYAWGSFTLGGFLSVYIAGVVLDMEKPVYVTIILAAFSLVIFA